MIHWTSDFETGMPELDRDHQRLAEGLNKLEELLNRGQGSASITAVLDFLERYANEHFSREESCMHRLKCPTAAQNVAAHAQFRQTFARAREKLQNPGSTALVARQVHGELVTWITSHIMRIDRGLRACVGR
ncbi:MAG TPA: hemerythrin family protein [Opitutaceae bacterium]|nr:hemerythrin family protein [Opitutaceae bacterium]